MRLGVTELRWLEEENHRLKRLVADLSLDKKILQDVIQKSSEEGAETRGGLAVYRIGVRRGYYLMMQFHTVYNYRSCRDDRADMGDCRNPHSL